MARQNDGVRIVDLSRDKYAKTPPTVEPESEFEAGRGLVRIKLKSES